MLQALVSGTTASLRDGLPGQALALGKNDHVRLVVAVTVDSSEQRCKAEQAAVPSICGEALQEALARGHDWAEVAYVGWCKFPTVRDMLESLAGLRKLCVDREALAEGFVQTDAEGDPPVFRLATPEDESRAPAATSALRRKVDELLTEEKELPGAKFLTACQDGKVVLATKMLRANPELIEHTDIFGATGLICAALDSGPQMVQELLKRRANPEAEDCSGATALAAAVCSGKPENVKLLVVKTQSRSVPSANVAAWANAGILAGLSVPESHQLEERSWDMLELAKAMAQRLATEPDLEDWQAKFEQIGRILEGQGTASEDAATTAAASAEIAAPYCVLLQKYEAQLQKCEAQQRELHELRRQLNLEKAREVLSKPQNGLVTGGAFSPNPLAASQPRYDFMPRRVQTAALRCPPQQDRTSTGGTSARRSSRRASTSDATRRTVETSGLSTPGWVEAYKNEKGEVPQDASQFREFVVNRGGSMSFSEAKKALK